MSIKSIFWNVQGVLGSSFNRYLKLLLNTHKPDIVALFEPRVSGSKADKFVQRHGFPRSFRVEARGFSGGIWLFWRVHILLDIIAVSNQFIHCFCVDSRSDLSFFLTAVYASPDARIRKDLWPQLAALNLSEAVPWVLGGDFNAIPESQDRLGGSRRRSGPRFTWGRGILLQRLDRCVGNDKWLDQWPQSYVSHLARLGSDHHPILLSTSRSIPQHSESPFRYLAARKVYGFNDQGKFVFGTGIAILVSITKPPSAGNGRSKSIGFNWAMVVGVMIRCVSRRVRCNSSSSFLLLIRDISLGGRLEIVFRAFQIL
ncbi:hypothetical protein GQ457_10G023960 [Hibiscus cannabinus]